MLEYLVNQKHIYHLLTPRTFYATKHYIIRFKKNDCVYPLIWMFAVHLYMVLIFTRDGNEYPINRVLARTSDYRISKSVFGYLENFFL